MKRFARKMWNKNSKIIWNNNVVPAEYNRLSRKEIEKIGINLLR